MLWLLRRPLFGAPTKHEEFVNANDAESLMNRPPSVIIKEQFYAAMKAGRELSKDELQDLAKKTLLSVEELVIRVEHLRCA